MQEKGRTGKKYMQGNMKGRVPGGRVFMLAKSARLKPFLRESTRIGRETSPLYFVVRSSVPSWTPPVGFFFRLIGGGTVQLEVVSQGTSSWSIYTGGDESCRGPFDRRLCVVERVVFFDSFSSVLQGCWSTFWVDYSRFCRPSFSRFPLRSLFADYKHRMRH